MYSNGKAILNEEDWDSILDNIEAGKTILCLGAEIYSNNNNTLIEQLRDALQVESNPNIKSYDDGLFHFKGGSDIKYYTQIKRFYEQEFPDLETIYDKIVRIQLPIILSINPDHRLRTAFERAGLSADYHFYFRRNPAPQLEEPTVNKPLIYNLLGDIKKRESMVLTYNDLFDYFQSIVEHRSMPQNIKERIHDAYNLIFIGLPFDKWYMQLLLRVLEQHTNDALKFAVNHANNERISTLCRDQFKITCVPTNIPEFVEELYIRCEKANLLRGKKAALSSYERWKSMIKREDKLSEVIDEMSEYFETHHPNDKEENNLLIQLSGKLVSLGRRISKGAISEPDAKVERALIRNAVVEFLENEVKSLNF
jgi:hypothetical protein